VCGLLATMVIDALSSKARHEWQRAMRFHLQGEVGVLDLLLHELCAIFSSLLFKRVQAQGRDRQVHDCSSEIPQTEFTG
jgi:hypothetical protein